MMYDTVREELQTKITPGIAPRAEAIHAPLPERMPMAARPSAAAPAPVPTPTPVKRQETVQLSSAKTSQTLVGFQSKNATLPDWRIQLQNAVQQRKGGVETILTATASGETQYPTNGGAALKAEIVQRVEPAPPVEIADPRVANAMRRIDESRKTFLEPQPVKPKFAAPKPQQARPFGVVSPNANASAAAPARVNVPQKPTLVAPIPVFKRDTNKLPPLPQATETPVVAESKTVETAKPVIERVEKLESGPLASEFGEIKRIHIRAEGHVIDEADQPDIDTDEIEDLAPFSMRFGAGLFDLIIGAFASMLVLSPIAFTNSNWFTAAGLLTFAATCAVLMFIYMTVCLGFFGKTMGMRLFSLELVDAVENEYPTLHQAAVNSSVFILSLLFGGAGFLAVFFNEERRAAHDLLSGTIIVREF